MDLLDLQEKAEKANHIMQTHGPESMLRWLDKQPERMLILKMADAIL